VSASATTPPAPPATTVAAGLGGGGGFRSPEEYLAHLRSIGETRFPYADQDEGRALDGAAEQLGHALAHFLDTFRAAHPGGWREGVRDAVSLLANAPKGTPALDAEQLVARYARSLAVLPTATEPTTPTTSEEPSA